MVDQSSLSFSSSASALSFRAVSETIVVHVKIGATVIYDYGNDKNVPSVAFPLHSSRTVTEAQPRQNWSHCNLQ